MPLFVKLLDPKAILPTCAHPGEDLAYDLYALEDVLLVPGEVTKVRTGIAAEHRRASLELFEDQSVGRYYKHVTDGLLIRDRSSMAVKGITTSGGVIDAGYRDEIVVLLTFNRFITDDQRQYERAYGYGIKAGDKIAQMMPIPVLTNEDVVWVENLSEAVRGKNGFGSTGR